VASVALLFLFRIVYIEFASKLGIWYCGKDSLMGSVSREHVGALEIPTPCAKHVETGAER
jgi:hypothetical protein